MDHLDICDKLWVIVLPCSLTKKQLKEVLITAVQTAININTPELIAYKELSTHQTLINILKRPDIKNYLTQNISTVIKLQETLIINERHRNEQDGCVKYTGLSLLRLTKILLTDIGMSKYVVHRYVPNPKEPYQVLSNVLASFITKNQDLKTQTPIPPEKQLTIKIIKVLKKHASKKLINRIEKSILKQVTNNTENYIQSYK